MILAVSHDPTAESASQARGQVISSSHVSGPGLTRRTRCLCILKILSLAPRVPVSSLVQSMGERPVSILASADASGIVVLLVCGAYRLLTIDLAAHRSGARKGKGRGSVGARSGHAGDSAVQRWTRSTAGPSGGSGRGSASDGGGGGVSGVDEDEASGGVRPLQLTLSSDASVLSALVEAEGHIELVQVSVAGRSRSSVGISFAKTLAAIWGIDLKRHSACVL